MNDDHTSHRLTRMLPRSLVATTLVAVVPVLALWGLRAEGIADSFLAATAAGAALSLGTYQLAALYWQRRENTDDVLFGDLMLWGWIRRWRQEQRLRNAAALLGLKRRNGGGDPRTLGLKRRADLLERLASDLEVRDPYTHGHSRRVARYSSLIAKRMGLTTAEVAMIRTAAAVHDVGKLETPLTVLHKPGRLTNDEFELIKRHPSEGAQMVAILEDDALTAVVLHHHERLDGTGYPHGLSGDDIPLGARIISVADTFDAITSARSYRRAKPHKQAIDILREEAGSQLDPDAVAAFCSVYLARRPLALWVALSNVGERLVGSLAADPLGSTTRVMAIAAGSVAVSGGAVALQAAGERWSRHTTSRAQAPGTMRPAGWRGGPFACCGAAVGSGATGRLTAGQAGTGMGDGSTHRWASGAIGAPGPGWGAVLAAGAGGAVSSAGVAASPAPPILANSGPAVSGSGPAVGTGTGQAAGAGRGPASRGGSGSGPVVIPSPGPAVIPGPAIVPGSDPAVSAGSGSGPAVSSGSGPAASGGSGPAVSVSPGLGGGTGAKIPAINVGLGHGGGSPSVGVHITGSGSKSPSISATASTGKGSAGVQVKVGGQGSGTPTVSVTVGGTPASSAAPSAQVKVGGTSSAGVKVGGTSAGVKVGATTSAGVKVGATSAAVSVGSTSSASAASGPSAASSASGTSSAGVKVGGTSSVAVKVGTVSVGVKVGL